MVADNNMQPFLIFYSQFLLVPIHCTTRIASLVPFQASVSILELARILKL